MLIHTGGGFASLVSICFYWGDETHLLRAKGPFATGKKVKCHCHVSQNHFCEGLQNFLEHFDHISLIISLKWLQSRAIYSWKAQQPAKRLLLRGGASDVPHPIVTLWMLQNKQHILFFFFSPFYNTPVASLESPSMQTMAAVCQSPFNYHTFPRRLTFSSETRADAQTKTNVRLSDIGVPRCCLSKHTVSSQRTADRPVSFNVLSVYLLFSSLITALSAGRRSVLHVIISICRRRTKTIGSVLPDPDTDEGDERGGGGGGSR